MRFLRTLGLLALFAAACRAAIVIALGPANRYPGYPYEMASQIGDETGGAIAFFLAGALGAGIAAFLTRKQGKQYPGLAAGILLILLFVWVYVAGRLV